MAAYRNTRCGWNRRKNSNSQLQPPTTGGSGGPQYVHPNILILNCVARDSVPLINPFTSISTIYGGRRSLSALLSNLKKIDYPI